MLQTRVSQPCLRDVHAVNGYLPPLGALRAFEAASRLMSFSKAAGNESISTARTKGGEGGIKQIALFRCAPDSRVVLVQTPHKPKLRRRSVERRFRPSSRPQRGMIWP
jgi:hypothetical protein